MAKNDKDQNKKKGRFFKDMKAELKKVVWPSKKQTANNTVAVIAFALILAIIVFVLDVVFDSINKYGITPLQEKITSSFSTKTEEDTASEDNEEGEKTDNESESAEGTPTDVEVEATSDEGESTNTTEETNTESQE